MHRMNALYAWAISKQQASSIVKSEQLQPQALLYPLFLYFPSLPFFSSFQDKQSFLKRDKLVIQIQQSPHEH